MTPSETGVVDVSDSARAALAELVSVYAARPTGLGGTPATTPVAGAGRCRCRCRWLGTGAASSTPRCSGRGGPGIVDVVAELGGRSCTSPSGCARRVRRPGSSPTVTTPCSARSSTTTGTAVVFDAARDAAVAAMLLERVSGEVVQPSLVRHLREDDAGRSPSPWRTASPSPSSTRSSTGRAPISSCFLALDEVGFNHLAAPLAVWRRAGRDLGVAQEYLAGASSGYALALTSVRDLYASGGPPELAGGDFGAEAHRLGTMTARMHLGLDKAFGRRPGDVGRWAGGIEEALRPLSPHVLERPDVEELLAELRALQVPSQAIRTHGDFHLGRTCRTEQGWYVVDFATGGTSPVDGRRGGRARRRRARLPVAPGRRGRHAVVPRARGDVRRRRARPVGARRPQRAGRRLGGAQPAGFSRRLSRRVRASAASSRPGARRCASSRRPSSSSGPRSTRPG